MCLGAAYWSRVNAVYYIASKAEASQAGFDDSFIYEELNLPHAQRKIPFIRMDISSFNEPFEEWGKLADKTLY